MADLGILKKESPTGTENQRQKEEADTAAGSTGVPDIAQKAAVPGAVIPIPAGTKPTTASEEENALNMALAAYNKAGGNKGGGLFLLNNDPAELLKKKLADIEEGLSKGKKVRDLMMEMANPEVTGEEDAAIKKNIPQADRSALDFLLNNPAPQLDKPEVNPRQELMGLIGTSIMQAVASAVNGSTGTTGLVADPGAQIGAEGFNKQLQTINLTEDKIREIEQKQTAIDLKHKDDIVAAMQAYDADMDETARMYLAERNRIMASKVAISEKELDLVLNAEQKALALTGQITELTNSKEMFNLSQRQKHSEQQGSIARESARFVHDWRQNRQLMAAMSAKNLVTAIGGEKTVSELQSGNLDGISVSSINNDMSLAVSRAQADPKYGEAFTNQMYVFSGDTKEAATAQYNYLENLLPNDDVTKKRVREESRIIIKSLGRVPGRLTTDALIKNPLTSMDGGRSYQIPPAVIDAFARENGDAIAQNYEPGFEALPTEEFVLRSFGTVDGRSTPELDADVFSYGSFTNQLVAEKWRNRLKGAQLKKAEKPN